MQPKFFSPNDKARVKRQYNFIENIEQQERITRVKFEINKRQDILKEIKDYRYLMRDQ